MLRWFNYLAVRHVVMEAPEALKASRLEGPSFFDFSVRPATHFDTYNNSWVEKASFVDSHDKWGGLRTKPLGCFAVN